MIYQSTAPEDGYIFCIIQWHIGEGNVITLSDGGYLETSFILRFVPARESRTGWCRLEMSRHQVPIDKQAIMKRDGKGNQLFSNVCVDCFLRKVVLHSTTNPFVLWIHLQKKDPFQKSKTISWLWAFQSESGLPNSIKNHSVNSLATSPSTNQEKKAAWFPLNLIKMGFPSFDFVTFAHNTLNSAVSHILSFQKL